MNDRLRVIFMGTPEFAVPSLEILIKSDVDVVCIITAPDKPKGRGQKVVASPVKIAAVEHHIPVLQPTNLKDEGFLKELSDYNADLQVVVAFRMLPEAVWNMPPRGTINLHGSLLPQYRGAAPINWAIINGEKETGVTTFFLQHKIDTGDLIYQEKEAIGDNDSFGDLYERLKMKGAQLILKTVLAIQAGNEPVTPQPVVAPLMAAPKLFKETCQINWSDTGQNVKNFIRGLSPYPCAWTVLHNKKCKIFTAEIIQEEHNLSHGTYISDGKNYIHAAVDGEFVAIQELQLEGKKRMLVTDFLRGYQWPD